VALVTVTRVSATSSLFENAISFAAGIKIGLRKKGRNMNALALGRHLTKAYLGNCLVVST